MSLSTASPARYADPDERSDAAGVVCHEVWRADEPLCVLSFAPGLPLGSALCGRDAAIVLGRLTALYGRDRAEPSDIALYGRDGALVVDIADIPLAGREAAPPWRKPRAGIAL
jgi:hypothetical protein